LHNMGAFAFEMVERIAGNFTLTNELLVGLRDSWPEWMRVIPTALKGAPCISKRLYI
jgi:hypothetical protein